MIERLPRAWRNVALVVLALLVLWFCWSIRSVLNPLLLGYLLAYILHPLVRRLEQSGLSQRASVLIIFLGGFLLITAILVGVGWQTKSLIQDIATDPELREGIRARVEAFHADLVERFGEERVPSLESLPDPAALLEWVRGFVQEHQQAAKTAGGAAVEAAGGVMAFLRNFLGGVIAVVGMFVLVPLYCYFLLFEIGRVNAWFQRYIPRRERERVTRVAVQIGEVLANFFRGRLLVCLMKGAVIFLGLLLLGVPYAFLFGMLGGFLSIVPFVGPMLTFVIALLIGINEHGVLGSLLRTGAVFGVAEILEGYVFIPKVMGDSLGLHEVVVLFALFAGGASLGMFGVLIALPVAAVVVILFREFVVPALTDWVEEESGTGTGTGAGET